MGKPRENEAVEVNFRSKHAEGWMPAYWGTAFSASDPHEEHNRKKCWRYHNTQDEVNCEVLRWRRIRNVA